MTIKIHVILGGEAQFFGMVVFLTKSISAHLKCITTVQISFLFTAQCCKTVS